jgi:hypothetical protein
MGLINPRTVSSSDAPPLTVPMLSTDERICMENLHLFLKTPRNSEEWEMIYKHCASIELSPAQTSLVAPKVDVGLTNDIHLQDIRPRSSVTFL